MKYCETHPPNLDLIYLFHTMSKRNKLQKFAENLAFHHVFENFDISNPQLIGQHGKEVDMKGVWGSDFFKNSNPITLELACGRGEYSLGLARRYPNRNFIGVDIKGARIWRGATNAIDENLENVAFLRTRIEIVDRFFEKGEISEIWITFPDPFLKKGKSNRRLTAPIFLDLYKKMLPPGGVIHLKTDSPELYEFSLEVLAEQSEIILEYQNDDIYSGPLPIPELDIKTYYEKMHLANGLTIKYVCFKLGV